MPPAPEARLVLLPLAAGHVDDDGPARVADVDEVLVGGGAPGRDEGRRVRDRVDEAELAERRGGQEPRARLVEDPPHVARRQEAVEAVLRVRRAPVGRARGLQDGDRARRLSLGATKCAWTKRDTTRAVSGSPQVFFATGKSRTSSKR